MAIPTGTKLETYEVTSHIGSGGMGDVYKAHDSKLGRDVAIKVLPEQFARDHERLARFQREAKMLAALNHPNIATIHGLEQSGNTHYLVMELVPGQTLAERIRGGAIPVDEALPIARQVADAVEYAHDKGVIHRDLKPANIKVTAEGTVKVLDFGLAKALSDEVAAEDMSNSPTLSLAATRQGVILGTAAYMSPEQAKGKTVDRRADVWAFGAVLYEMLAGNQAFPGEDITEVLAAVVKSEPALDALPAKTPLAIRNLLCRSLDKNLRRRLRDIGEARIVIEQILAGDTGDVQGTPVPVVQVQPLWWRALPWSLAAVLALLAGLAFWSRWRAAPAPRAVARFTIAVQPGDVLVPNTGGLAVSPDGSYIAFSASRSGGTRQIFLRPMASSTATAIPGTDNSTGLFLSPDGQWIAFTADGKLKKVPVSGGTPIVLSDKGSGTAGAWGPDGTIFFGESESTTGRVMRVPATGGTPQIVATIEFKPGELEPRWFEVLPGGKAILYAMGGTNGAFSDDATIVAQSVSTGERKTVVQGGTFPRYLSTGHLLYAQGGRLLAAPFDLRRLEVTGAAVPILEDVWQGSAGYSAYGVSVDGSVAYINGAEAGGVRPIKLSLVDRSGAGRALIETPHRFLNPALSPDGRQVAIVNADVTTTPDIWVLEVARSTLTRLTFDKSGEQASSPVWTPDGKRVVYSVLSGTTYKLMSKAADGSGAEDMLLSDSDVLVPASVSPDGRLLVFNRRKGAGPRNLWVLELDGEHKVRPLIESPFNKVEAQISPDGRWLAYVSDESNRRDVFVQPFPALGGKWQISTAGGFNPRWSRDGRQMFYRNSDTMMIVDIESKTGFTAGTPRAMFDQTSTATPGYAADYDVALDGQHFVMLKDERTQDSPLELRVILNWADEVKRRVPTGTK